MPMYLMLYGSFRFVVEFYRGDGNPQAAFGLTQQQLYAIGFVVLGAILFAVLRRRSGDAEPAPVKNDETSAGTS